eukprot:CAMPEP_0204604854 /NCGR_PEP_ID=MMETSP0661-20131031/58128_1 /ASSEMBLY_ACC=CAM_ASM_000606 /TAXON_ID=109239 /ORGANISM="Alexandrium margalefi, Strain AMGDE01CS-322" /LENGTH=595 /DNA_ID=CAMNT_0051616045 /DNA_START=89 /DNA_END=1876 /DNA_ORIENTATION=-
MDSGSLFPAPAGLHEELALVQVSTSVRTGVGLFAEASSRSQALLEHITVTVGMEGAVPQADVISCVVLASVLGIFILTSIPDFHRFLTLPKDPIEDKLAEKPSVKEAAQDSAPAASPPPASMATILGLTFYRFYTGFLSATWLPYLLAMEGAELWRDNQALFMGLAKLIYGLSILLTPIFGLLGDRLAFASHALGRRLFVRVGIIVAAAGIFLCHWSAQSAPRRPGHFSLFMLGILIWRLGEGFNDVTTEAICPEMLPSQQYEISSAIRASMFLVGGLGGYVMVMLLVHMPYYWLYHGYLIMMFVCGIPPLLAISRDIPKINTRGASRVGTSFLKSCVEAYVKPSQYEGGFPCACLCIFLFSCGSAPMFFLLLMLRDLVGIDEQVSLQRHFSLISIDFFLSAAVAAVLNALVSPKKPTGQSTASQSEIRESSFRFTAFAVMSFGVVCILMPFVHFLPHKATRAQALYFLAALMGATFGSVYSRFQDCTWQLLPPNVEFANAMGFSTMWKLLGAGLGNFFSGLVLDLFQSAAPLPAGTDVTHATHLVAYKLGGYMAVCFGSAALAFIAGGLVLTIPGKAVKARSEEKAEKIEGQTG